MFSAQSPDNLATLASDVVRLSNFFIQRPDDQTPWDERFCQNAYRNYFLPLNYIRVANVIRRGQQVGYFQGFESTVDWGAGPGTASYALAHNDELKKQIQNQVLIEKSTTALNVFTDLHSQLIKPTLTAELNLKKLPVDPAKSLLVFSYSLTEMATLPPGYDQFEGLMILEPATSQDGRRLLELRQKLISKGYWMWAPCPHQSSCPLLTDSKYDWCHDRFHVEAPEWFSDLEEQLPIKNNTVTTSYILARKMKPTYDYTMKARLVGDSLLENGKTRQLLCRGPAREFLTWMHKSIEPQTLPRGEIIELPTQSQTKSNELRTLESVQIVKD